MSNKKILTKIKDIKDIMQTEKITIDDLRKYWFICDSY